MAFNSDSVTNGVECHFLLILQSYANFFSSFREMIDKV